MITFLEICGLIIVAIVIIAVFVASYQDWRRVKQAKAIMKQGGPKTLEEYLFLYPNSCQQCGGRQFTVVKRVDFYELHTPVSVGYEDENPYPSGGANTFDTGQLISDPPKILHEYISICERCNDELHIGSDYSPSQEEIDDLKMHRNQNARLSPYSKIPGVTEISEYPFVYYQFKKAETIMKRGGPKTLQEYRFLFPNSCDWCGGRKFTVARIINQEKTHQYLTGRCKRCNNTSIEMDRDYDPLLGIGPLIIQFNEMAQSSPYSEIPGVVDLPEFPYDNLKSHASPSIK